VDTKKQLESIEQMIEMMTRSIQEAMTNRDGNAAFSEKLGKRERLRRLEQEILMLKTMAYPLYIEKLQQVAQSLKDKKVSADQLEWLQQAQRFTTFNKGHG
jgi:hypothetical protein